MGEAADKLTDWLDNADEHAYRQIQEIVASAKAQDADPKEYRDCRLVGERIRDEVIQPEGLLQHMLHLVEWREVGGYYLAN